jgi:amidophosphoribosyltransferase
MCGIIGILSEKDDNNFYDLYEGLYHLQHRGQDSFGISYLDNTNHIKSIKYNEMLSNVNIDKSPNFKLGIGHVRYPTSGNITINECQPFTLINKYYNISMVHNGQISVTDKLLSFFKDKDIKIDENITSDSIYLLYLLSYYLNQYEVLNNDILINIVSEIQNLLEGSYNCICIINNSNLICFKDKNSIRPLIYGKCNDKRDNTKYMISSESVSLTSLGYEIITDIYGKDLLYFNGIKLHKLRLLNEYITKPCLFEWVYLAREETILYNVNVYESRMGMGKHLANKIINILGDDLKNISSIIPIPDTSKPVALSISKTLNIPYYEAITKNRYVNRTFIMNTQGKRQKNIKRKLNIIKHLVEKKDIIIVDDSIVRGNTIKHIINLLKENNVGKIYVVSCSPPIINKNIYGIDIPDKEDLLLYNKSIEELEKELDINLIFQGLDDLKNSINIYNPELKIFEDSIFKK